MSALRGEGGRNSGQNCEAEMGLAEARKAGAAGAHGSVAQVREAPGEALRACASRAGCQSSSDGELDRPVAVSVLCRPAQLSDRRACQAAQPHHLLCLYRGTEGSPAGSHAEFCLRRSQWVGPISGPLATGFLVTACMTRLEWVKQWASGCPEPCPEALSGYQGHRALASPGMTGAPLPRSCAFT